MPITKRDVDSIEAKTMLWDRGRGSVTGFGVRCQGQRRTFILKYNHAGRSRWYTIGSFGSPWTVEDARIEARRLLGLVATGHDPAADRTSARKASPTKEDVSAVSSGPLIISDLCDRYLEAANAGTILTRFKRPKKASTLADDVGRIARHIKPLIGTVPVADLDRHQINRMIADISSGKTSVDEKTKLRGRAIVTGGKTTAARVADLLSGIMAWAMDMNMIQANPVHGVRRYRAQPRERFLSEPELARLGSVLAASRKGEVGAFHPYSVSIIELLCLTGCRLSEIAALRWSEVDEPNQCFRLEDTKTGRSMRPVGRAAIDCVKAQNRVGGADFVFPATRGHGAYQGTKRQARSIFTAAEINGASSHTLRHTFGSVASGLGYSDATIAGLLGHAGRGVTSRYVHRPDDALRSAADAVASHIDLVLGRESK